MKPDKKRTYPAVKVACEKFRAEKVKEMPGFVYVKGYLIDLTASGTEDWQVARNIIDQM